MTKDYKGSALQLLCDESDTFVETLHTLRRLIAIAHPQATLLDENPTWREAIDKAKEGLPSDKRAILMATLTEATPYVLRVLRGTLRTPQQEVPEQEWQEVEATELFQGAIPDGVIEMMESQRQKNNGVADFQLLRSADGYSRVRIEDVDVRFAFQTIIDKMERSRRSPSHEAVLMRSILVMTVSAFELLVGSLFRAHIMSNRGAAENPDVKSFSLSDLYAFGSIDDAIDETIFQQADSFSRKGVRTWASWFRGKPMGIDLGALALDWPRTEEVFERRNVVVHNGSRLTRQYLNNVDAQLLEGYRESSPVEVSPAYLDEAITRLLALGTLLSFQVRLKLFRKTGRVAASDWINDRVFELLRADQFEAVVHITSHLDYDDLVHVDELTTRVNGWIAKRRLQGLDACQNEISEWDTSGLDIKFRAAKYVLLDDRENAVRTTRECLASKSLIAEYLLEWPLFHWMRESGDVDLLLHEAAEGHDEPLTKVESATTEVGPPSESAIPPQGGGQDGPPNGDAPPDEEGAP
jgi:hypothetical protein